MYILDFVWGRPACDAIEFHRIHGQLPGFNDHPKVFDLISGKFTFFKFQVEVQLGHVLQDTFSSFFMKSSVWGINEKVVHVDDEPSFSNHITERVVHEPLEGSRSW